RQRRGDAEYGRLDPPLAEHPPQPPETGPRSVFVDRLHVHVTHAGPGLCADDLGQKRLRGGVPMEDVVLAAFLVVDDELHREACTTWPARVGWNAAVADHVARVAGGGGHG